MSLLTPLSLTFAALAIPILLLYVLRLRRRDVLVSSTLLWQRLLRDREANAPWQRLRRNLLLLLQLLILALMTLALARPFVPAPTLVTGSVVLLLDASASMQARDAHGVAPTRFDAGLRAAREIVAALGTGDVATVIAVGPQPRVLASATGDRALLRRALERATPTNGPADWDAAFALAAASLSAAPEAQAVVISDGALPQPLPSLPASVRFVGVGGGNHNLGLAALATREGPTGPQAFLRVVNYSDAQAEPLVELSADGLLFDARRLPVPPHASADLTFADLPYDLQVLQARLNLRDAGVADDHEDEGDALPLDDTAWTVRTPAASGRVLLVSDGNLFLEQALAALLQVDLVRLPPSSPIPPPWGGTEGGYDLYVYDGPVTGTLPPGNLWLIAPPSPLPPGEELGQDEAIVAVGDLFTATTITHVAAADPLLRYVDLDAVHVLQARAVEPPSDARVLVEAQGGPLLFVVERPERRLAVLTFDLHDSDLPLHVAFPVLTANLVDWLLPGGAPALPELIRPGDPVPLQPHPEAAEIQITAPDGVRHTLPVGDIPPVFVATDQLGAYWIQHLDRSDRLLRSAAFAVNLFDPAESDIAPRDVLQVGQTQLSPTARQQRSRREFWPWLAAAALGVLTLEWWTYQRGQMFGALLGTTGKRGG